MSDHRSLVLSLDGATWDILDPLIESGYLPTIESLRTGGAAGSLESVCPPITAAAWLSFQTGLDPAHHGVYTFSHVQEGGRKSTTVDATTIDHPTLWDYLDAQGLDTVTINLPGTYPADALPGTVISGIMAPSFDDTEAVSDDTVRSLVRDTVPGYEVFRNPRDQFDPHEEPRAFVSAMTENVHSREAVGEALLNSESWDVATVHIQATDVLQHPLWKHLDPDHPAHDDALYDVVAEFYREVDDALNTILSAAREQADSLDVYLVSDHGFQPLHRKVNADAMLEELDYLVRPDDGGNLRTKLLELAKRIDIFGIREYVLSKEKRVSLGQKLNAGRVDWERSKAWAHGNLYGYVYLQEGANKAEIVAAIEQFDRDHGGHLVDSVIDVHDRWDNLAADVPDLVIVPASHVGLETLNAPLDGSPVESVDYEQDFHVGGHAKDGIVVVAGDGAAEGTRLTGARLVDLMPTILARHRVGVPADVDGTVLTDAFVNPVEADEIEPLTDRERESSEEQRQAVEDRLRNLGYRE